MGDQVQGEGGRGGEWQNQSGDTKTSTKRIEVKVRGLQVILEEAHNLLISQEGYFGDKGLDAKLWRSTGVYIPGERDSPT